MVKGQDLPIDITTRIAKMMGKRGRINRETRRAVEPGVGLLQTRLATNPANQLLLLLATVGSLGRVRFNRNADEFTTACRMFRVILAGDDTTTTFVFDPSYLIVRGEQEGNRRTIYVPRARSLQGFSAYLSELSFEVGFRIPTVTPGQRVTLEVRGCDPSPETGLYIASTTQPSVAFDVLLGNHFFEYERDGAFRRSATLQAMARPLINAISPEAINTLRRWLS